MTGLADLQRAFQRRVLDGDPAFEALLVPPAAGLLGDRVAAYAGGYRARLVEALGITYPVLRQRLGDGEFERRMHAYIEAAPSRHYSIRYYGEGVAASLDGDPLLSGIARWEWLLAEVFDAPDDEPFHADRVAAIPADAWPGLRLRLRSSARRITVDRRAVSAWRTANGQAPKPDGVPDGAPDAAPGAQAAQWIAWRRGIATFFRSLDATETVAIDAVLAGEPFGELCERLALVLPAEEVAMRAASLLRGWIAEELLAAIDVPDAPA